VPRLAAVRDEAVVYDGAVAVRAVLRLTMTSDHRVLDGAVSAAFLRDLVELLEQPLRLLA
jgi:pyruvate dehydrogenase E2 component (dihydrolipoamide acetyltransferase)